MSDPTPNIEVGASSSAPNNVQATPRVKFYFPGQKYLVYFGAFYLCLLLLLTIPYVQRK